MTSCRALILILFYLLISSAVFGQDRRVIQDIDKYIEKAHQQWQVPGMAIAIVKDGKVVLSKGYGVLEKGKTEKVDQHTLFAIASNTKAFISASLAILEDEGKISWDDPVIKYLPYFRMYDDYVTQNITIRDLLSHRSGLGNFSGDVIWYKSEYTAEEVIRHAEFVPSAFPFRSGYGYSNLMFITAGEVIKVASGLSWDQFAKKRIMGPIKMDRTITSVSNLKNNTNYATPHKPTLGIHQPIPWVAWDNMGAAGGIISSVKDMARWIQLQIDEGIHKKDTIFSVKNQEVFWTPHNNALVNKKTRMNYPGRDFSGYGLGWGVSSYGGEKVVSHGGGYDGMYSRVVIVPDRKIGIVVLTNGMYGISTPLTYYILDRFFGHPQKDWSQLGWEGQLKSIEKRKALLLEWENNRVKNTKPGKMLAEYAGVFVDPMFGEIEIKYTEKDQLQLLFPKAPLLDAQLSHWHFNTFQINWNEPQAWFDFGTVQFIFTNKGKIEALKFDVPNGDIFFHEIHAKRVE